MKNYALTTSLAILLGGLLACNNAKEKPAASAVQKSTQAQLHIPKELKMYAPFKNYLLDSAGIASSQFKIYVSINFSCPTCIDRIKEWQKIATELSKNKIPVIIIGNTDDRFVLIKYLCSTGAIVNFSYPFLLDNKSEFSHKNKAISDSGEINAVLTDQNNAIILEGDILHSPEAKAQFFNKINGI